MGGRVGSRRRGTLLAEGCLTQRHCANLCLLFVGADNDIQ